MGVTRTDVSQAIQERVEAGVRELSDEEVAAYVENGWAKLERLIAPELAADLLARAQRLMGSEGDASELREGVDMQTTWWHDFRYPSEQDELFNALVHSQKMGRNALRLLGATVPADFQAIRYFSDGLFVKLSKSTGGGYHATDFHADHNVLKPQDRVGKMNFWFALDEVTPEQGALRFYSGSQRLGDLGCYFPEGSSITDVYPKLGEWCPLSPPNMLRPGDATVHQAFCIHGAPENTSDRPRWAYTLTYIQPEACYTGYPYYSTDDLGLEVGKPLDHPRFKIIYSER